MKKYSICFFAIYCLCFLMLWEIYPTDKTEFRETSLWENPGVTYPSSVFSSTLNSKFDIIGDQEIPVAGEIQSSVEKASSDLAKTEPIYLVYGGISEILICYPDETTVYKRIPLVPEDLSPEDRNELVQGMTFHSLEELYHYLESITS